MNSGSLFFVVGVLRLSRNTNWRQQPTGAAESLLLLFVCSLYSICQLRFLLLMNNVRDAERIGRKEKKEKLHDYFCLSPTTFFEPDTHSAVAKFTYIDDGADAR